MSKGKYTTRVQDEQVTLLKLPHLPFQSAFLTFRGFVSLFRKKLASLFEFSFRFLENTFLDMKMDRVAK